MNEKNYINSLKDKATRVSIVKGINQNDVVFNVNYENKFRSNYHFVFNRRDSSLIKVIGFTPKKPHNLKKNQLIYSYSEYTYEYTPFHNLTRLNKIEIFSQNGEIIKSELQLKKIEDQKIIQEEKKKTICKVMMLPTSENVRLCNKVEK